MISKFDVGLKTHLSDGLSEIYGDLVYKFKELTGTMFFFCFFFSV